MSLEGMTSDQVEALANLAKSIADNPKTRLKFQSLVKEAHPDANTPELDSALAMRELASKHDKTREEFEAYKAQQEARENEMREWAEVVGSGVCKYDDIAAISQFMADNGIANKAFGAKSWSQSKTLAEPSSAATRTFEMPGDFISRWKTQGSKGLNQMARDEALSALQDFRMGKAV